MNLDTNYRVYSPYIIEGKWYREGINIGNSQCSGAQRHSKAFDDLLRRVVDLENSMMRDVHVVSGEWVDDDTINITLSNNKVVTISRNRVQHILTITAKGGEATGAGKYVSGSSVNLRAKPDTGKVFVGWYDGDTLLSKDVNYTLILTTDRNIKAMFGDMEYNLIINVPTGTNVNVSVDGIKSPYTAPIKIRHGVNVSIESTANVGWAGLPDDARTQPNQANFVMMDNYVVGMSVVVKQTTINIKDKDSSELIASISGTPGSNYNHTINSSEGKYIYTIDNETINKRTHNIEGTYPSSDKDIYVKYKDLVTYTLGYTEDVLDRNSISGIPGESVNVRVNRTGKYNIQVDIKDGNGYNDIVGDTLTLTIPETNSTATITFSKEANIHIHYIGENSEVGNKMVMTTNGNLVLDDSLAFNGYDLTHEIRRDGNDYNSVEWPHTINNATGEVYIKVTKKKDKTLYEFHLDTSDIGIDYNDLHKRRDYTKAVNDKFKNFRSGDDGSMLKLVNTINPTTATDGFKRSVRDKYNYTIYAVEHPHKISQLYTHIANEWRPVDKITDTYKNSQTMFRHTFNYNGKTYNAIMLGTGGTNNNDIASEKVVID